MEVGKKIESLMLYFVGNLIGLIIQDQKVVRNSRFFLYFVRELVSKPSHWDQIIVHETDFSNYRMLPKDSC